MYRMYFLCGGCSSSVSISMCVKVYGVRIENTYTKWPYMCMNVSSVIPTPASKREFQLKRFWVVGSHEQRMSSSSSSSRCCCCCSRWIFFLRKEEKEGKGNFVLSKGYRKETATTNCRLYVQTHTIQSTNTIDI